jgi:hypothetical protein
MEKDGGSLSGMGRNSDQGDGDKVLGCLMPLLKWILAVLVTKVTNRVGTQAKTAMGFWK